MTTEHRAQLCADAERDGYGQLVALIDDLESDLASAHRHLAKVGQERSGYKREAVELRKEVSEVRSELTALKSKHERLIFEFTRARDDRDESDKELVQIADALGLKNALNMPIMEKLRDMTAKIGEQGDEIERLKTPHCCAECEHCSMSRCDNPLTGVAVISPLRRSWLCGHFKAKGTK